MERYIDDVLMLTVNFLDMCQTRIMNGKIDIKLYHLLTSFKLSFIKYILESQKITGFEGNELQIKLDSILLKDSLIRSVKADDFSE